jgi:hypothetical protein
MSPKWGCMLTNVYILKDFEQFPAYRESNNRSQPLKVRYEG